MRLLKNSCSEAVVVFAVWDFAPSCWIQHFICFDTFPVANTSVSRNFVTSRCTVVLFSTSMSRYAMLHEEQQTISMRSNVQEWTHVLTVNTPCSHRHSFCATGVSSGLATRVTLTRVSRGRLGESLTRGLTFWFFVPIYVIVVGLRFKRYTLCCICVRRDASRIEGGLAFAVQIMARSSHS
jgi:hypothetical protein